MSPGLEERLNTGTEEDLIYVSNMVRHGCWLMVLLTAERLYCMTFTRLQGASTLRGQTTRNR